MGVLKTFLGSVVTQHPWTYGLVLFFTSKLVNSQGAAVAIVMPMALGLGMDPVMVMSFLPACYGYFFLPTYPSDLTDWRYLRLRHELRHCPRHSVIND